MAGNDKKVIGMVFQCAFCGSYAVLEVGSLVDHEVELIQKTEAAAKSSGKKPPKSKGLKKDLHAAEEEYMSRICQQKREAGANWLPCSCCIEHYSGWRYMELIHAAVERPGVVLLPLQKPLEMLLSPLLPVAFEDLPPVYRKLDGKWTLAEGVGPKTLEVLKSQPSRLPASQFKLLLKGEVAKPPGIEFSACGMPNTDKAGYAGKGAPAAEVQFEYREFLAALWALEDFEDVWSVKIAGMHGEDGQQGPSHPSLSWAGRKYVERPAMCIPPDELAAITQLLRDMKLEDDALRLATS